MILRSSQSDQRSMYSMSSIRRRYDFGIGHSWIQNAAYWPLARVLLRAAREGAGAEGEGDAGWAPLAAALLFVVHPLQTQAVSYVVQRVASLAALFYLTALALYAWARTDGPAPRRARALAFAGALASALLAMFTKEIAFTLPFAIVLLELAFFRGPARTRAALVAPFLLLLPVIPWQLGGSDRPLTQLMADVGDLAQVARADSTLPRAAYLATQARVVVTYLRLALLPAGQNLDHDFPVERSFLAVPVLLSVAGLGGATLTVVQLRLFREGVMGGRGWIAVALVIFARWKPGLALVGATSLRRAHSSSAPLPDAGVTVIVND